MRDLKVRDPKQAKSAPSPWRVPVALEDILETGQHFDLAADAVVREALRQMAGLRDLPRLEAAFDVTRHGVGGLQVAGRVSATVGQTCVVTLEPLTNEVEEEVDLVFAPRCIEQRNMAAEMSYDATKKKFRSDPFWGEPELLVDGIVDLGAVAIEFLVLGLDPYPRKPGAVFEPPQDVKPQAGPFAALARLTKGGDGH